MNESDHEIPDDLPGAIALLQSHRGELRVRRRHFLPDLLLVHMYFDVLEQCAAVETLTKSDVPHAAYTNARAALEAAAEMMYLTASADTYDERGAAGRAFELVSLDRLGRQVAPLADRALEHDAPPDDSPSPEEIIGEEGRYWGEEFTGALGAVERALKTAQEQRGGNWTGLSRSAIAEEATKAWGAEASAFAPVWDFLYGHLSFESHPGMRTGARAHDFDDEGRLTLTPRPRNSIQPQLAARLSAYIAVRSAKRSMAFPSAPDLLKN